MAAVKGDHRGTVHLGTSWIALAYSWPGLHGPNAFLQLRSANAWELIRGACGTGN